MEQVKALVSNIADHAVAKDIKYYEIDLHDKSRSVSGLMPELQVHLLSSRITPADLLGTIYKAGSHAANVHRDNHLSCDIILRAAYAEFPHKVGTSSCIGEYTVFIYVVPVGPQTSLETEHKFVVDRDQFVHLLEFLLEIVPDFSIVYNNNEHQIVTM